MRRYQGTVVLVVALALVMAACSSKNTPAGGSSSTSGGAPSATATSGGGGGGVSSASIVAQGFAFTPNSVNVSAGQVTLTVTNKDNVEHTFTLDDGSSDTNLPPGQTVTITLNLTKTVGWHCKIHPSMTGTLIVG